jgi:hypothetical protein
MTKEELQEQLDSACELVRRQITVFESLKKEIEILKKEVKYWEDIVIANTEDESETVH